MNYACPCCDFLTLSEEIRGSFEICPVCNWEDDNVQFDNPTFVGGANHINLLTAKENFKKFGAIKEEFLKFVRKPSKDELPGL
jgi:hypothetical protein